jgi:ABC-type multidrug transport system ATPase subunit
MRGTTTVLLTDTQIDFALGVADQILLLDHGTLIFRGDRGTLLSQVHNFSSTLPVESWLRAQTFLNSRAQSSRHRQLAAKALGLE